MSKLSAASAWRHKRWARLRDALEEDVEAATASEPPSAGRAYTTESAQHSAGQNDPGARHRNAVIPSAPLAPIAPPSPSPPPPPPKIASQLDDLLHLQLAFIQGMVQFTSHGRALRFMKNPSRDGVFTRWHIQSGEPCNSGKCALDTKAFQNQPFLEHQNWLTMSFIFLKSTDGDGDAEVGEYRKGLARQIVEELERLEDLKEWEWGKQETDQSASCDSVLGTRFMINTGASPSCCVCPSTHSLQRISDRYVAAQWTSWTPDVAPIYAHYAVAATANLLLGLSRKATGAVMGGLRSTIRLAIEYARAPGPLLPQDHRLLRQLVRDPRTVINVLDLDPRVTAYNCCSCCFALYNLDEAVPLTCTERAAPESMPCGAKLLRRRRIGDGVMGIPVRKYLHQSLKHWLGRMLCREDIEVWLQLARWNGGNASTLMRDIFDGIALQSLRGPDPGKAYLDGPPHELRLVFALSADGFNPYQMKEAKQSVTSTAIYLVCLNLPQHLRYLPENIYLAGVVPGPTKPSTSQINHFLKLVVDEFLDFWNPGIYYTRTALRPQGRLARAALVPLVADLLAARQLSGLGPHNHRLILCSVCKTPADNIENTDTATFEPRDLKQHRANANAWLEARTTFEREQLFERTGVRYSELLRLDYWNPFLYTVVDTMHNLYLGILQRHVRTIWGINVDMEDGDASGITAGAQPGRPDEDKMAAGTHYLLHGSLSQLRGAGKAVLYHLCLDRGIRRAGTVSQLIKNLVAWVRSLAHILSLALICRAHQRKKEGIPVASQAVPEGDVRPGKQIPLP